MYLIPTLIILILIAYIFLLKYSKTETKEKVENLPYVKKEYLMTVAERTFYKVLHGVVGDKYYIIPQVPLKNVVQVNKYERLKRTYQNKIDRKCLDFVLFDKEYFTPHLVIELDDSSHQLPIREERDHFVNAVMQKVGLRIEHVKTAYEYDSILLSSLIQFPLY